MENIIKFNNRVNRTLKNPNITFFIIMLLILLISCYTFINEPIRNTISSILSIPIVTLFALIGITIIGYFNLVIALLLLILLFICVFGFGNTLPNIITTTNDMYYETFISNKDNDNDNDNDKNTEKTNNKIKHISRIEQNNRKKKEKDKELDDRVKNIKETLLGPIMKFRQNNDDNYKNAILENKQKIFEEEKKNNKSKSTFKNINNDHSSKNINSKTNKKEKFQTIEPRKFDPSSDEDTNLLITREILDDVNNRIQYNYESPKYLKKYIKNRIEEIIDINKLTDSE